MGHAGMVGCVVALGDGMKNGERWAGRQFLWSHRHECPECLMVAYHRVFQGRCSVTRRQRCRKCQKVREVKRVRIAAMDERLNQEERAMKTREVVGM